MAGNRIALLDQRGTGQSAAMNCEEDEEILEGRFSREQTIVDTRACLDQLPHDPRFFTTSVAVRDLEALREALGYTKFNLYGISYGSRVAQHFARRYPESTRTIILDGVVPPQIALGPGIAVEAQNALEAIFDRCTESAACTMAFPDIREEFGRLRDTLEDEPLTITLPNPVSGKPEEIRFGRTEMPARSNERPYPHRCLSSAFGGAERRTFTTCWPRMIASPFQIPTKYFTRTPFCPPKRRMPESCSGLRPRLGLWTT